MHNKKTILELYKMIPNIAQDVLDMWIDIRHVKSNKRQFKYSLIKYV